MTPARRYVATVVEHERDIRFDIFLRDTELDRWVTLADSASPEPTFTLTTGQSPLLTVLPYGDLLAGAAEAMSAVYKALVELSLDLLRRELDKAR